MLKTCVNCKLFFFKGGYRPYSEDTPGDDPKMFCDATPPHWEIDLFDAENTELVTTLLTAEKCPDFIECDPRNLLYRTGELEERIKERDAEDAAFRERFKRKDQS